MSVLAGLGLLLEPSAAFGADLLAVVGGAFYVGGLADTRKDGITGGLIYAGAGIFLGTLVSIPVGTALATGANLVLVGVAILIGFMFGLLYAVIFGVIGAVAGYAGAMFMQRLG